MDICILIGILFLLLVLVKMRHKILTSLIMLLSIPLFLILITLFSYYSVKITSNKSITSDINEVQH